MRIDCGYRTLRESALGHRHGKVRGQVEVQGLAGLGVLVEFLLSIRLPLLALAPPLLWPLLQGSGLVVLLLLKKGLRFNSHPSRKEE